jgi:hypothetical protein
MGFSGYFGLLLMIYAKTITINILTTKTQNIETITIINKQIENKINYKIQGFENYKSFVVITSNLLQFSFISNTDRKPAPDSILNNGSFIIPYISDSYNPQSDLFTNGFNIHTDTDNTIVISHSMFPYPLPPPIKKGP